MFTCLVLYAEIYVEGMYACLMLCAGNMSEECLPALCYVQETYEGGVSACLMLRAGDI